MEFITFVSFPFYFSFSFFFIRFSPSGPKGRICQGEEWGVFFSSLLVGLRLRAGSKGEGAGGGVAKREIMIPQHLFTIKLHFIVFFFYKCCISS